MTFKTKILPELAAGRMTLEQGSRALGKKQKLFERKYSMKDGTFNPRQPVFSDMDDEGKAMLRDFIN